MRDVNYEKLTKRAIAVYTRERIALVNNDAGVLRDCAIQKAELLKEISEIEKQIDAQLNMTTSVQCRDQLESVQAIIARRASENGQLQRANRSMADKVTPK